MNVRTATGHIVKRGALLVYPIKNRPEPGSLWRCFFPKTKMRWEWDDEGDSRVAEMWHLREELARSRRVVYSKWFCGRATFFSKDIFRGLLAESIQKASALPEDAQELLSHLEETSPLSTKELKQASGLQGKFFETTYAKSLKSLWERFLVVGIGEKDDGAFPSLLMGATRSIFEELYQESQGLSPEGKAKTLIELKSKGPLFHRYFEKLHAKW